MNQERNEEVEIDVTPTSKATVHDNKKTAKKLIKIAIVGTGNCGGMMTNDACEELGLDGIAINGSERDLELITCKTVIPFPTGETYLSV